MAAGLLLCAVLSGPSLAQDTETESQPEFGDADKATRCVHSRYIDKTDVLDDGNILFYMRRGEVYINHMPNRCPGLRHGDVFTYQTSSSELCSVDMITVLERFGTSLRQGATCPLGLFYPIDAKLAQEMSKRSR
jgi:hypothetical protein